MVKLVVLKLDGNLETNGLQVSLEIASEGKRPEIEIAAQLPPAPDLIDCLNRWQENYRNVGAPYRIKPKKITYDGSVNKRIQECQQAAKELGNQLSAWLDSDQFRPIDKRLREELNRDETIRLLIRTEDNYLQKLPWHLWDFFDRYPLAEVALSTKKLEVTKKINSVLRKEKVRILAILGHSDGLDIEKDRSLLSNLPNTEVVFLVEPKRQEINDQLWEQSWDIIFFAGHSETEGETGIIYINPTESLTINELWYALRKAVEGGLQLALFNSCDGLGLARQLDDLHIPQMIVMRELVPDRVAQEFLKYFLTSFVSGKSFYLAVRSARERLQGMESQFPCATWLPAICQNPAEIPRNWQDLLPSKNVDSSSLENIQNIRLKIKNLPIVLLASVVVTAAVVGVRSLGFLQAWELQAFDRLMRSRPDESADSRILIVEVNENDIRRYNHPLPDTILAKLLDKIQQHQPVVIGLNIYRDLPVQPGYQAIRRNLQGNKSLITVCHFIVNKEGMNPPPTSPEKQRSFNNLQPDLFDDSIRRYLLSRTPNTISTYDRCNTPYSFSFQLAYKYLEAKKIPIKTTEEKDWQFNDIVLKRLSTHSGGYQNLDAGGNHILINYRATSQIAQKVTVTDILTDRFDSAWIKDKIVIIGVTAESIGQLENTPIGKINVLFIHAQMVSQILSAVENNRPLIWWLPQWGDAIWIWIWSFTGGAIAWYLQRSPLRLWLTISIAIAVLYGICFSVLIQGGWLAIFPAILAIFASALFVTFSRHYRQ